MSSHRPPAAFTLIEVLICLTIGVVISTVCTVVVLQCKRLISLTQVRLMAHQEGQAIQSAVQNAIQAMPQTSAMLLRVQPGGELQLIFLNGHEDHNQWQWYNQYPWRAAEFRWNELRWAPDPLNPEGGLLTLASSTSPDAFRVGLTTGTGWSPLGIDYRDAWFFSLPQPRRSLLMRLADGTTDTSKDPLWVLDSNHYGTPERYVVRADQTRSTAVAWDWGDTTKASTAAHRLAMGPDVGDFGNLVRNRTIIARNVARLVVQLVPQAGGAVQTYDTEAATATPATTTLDIVAGVSGAVIDGVGMDGRGVQWAASPGAAEDAAWGNRGLLSRPKLLRLRLDLVDFQSPKAGVDLTNTALPLADRYLATTIAFSVRTPSLSPEP